VVKRSVSNSIIVSENANNINCLIWDEVSVSSQRILEVVNHIQIKISRGTENCGAKPFGGIQAIMVGEFTQLSPVPNLMDDGQFMFRSPVLIALVLVLLVHMPFTFVSVIAIHILSEFPV